jgi:hypothetical protein
MRLVRTLAIVPIALATFAGPAASPASADGGGAYLNFDRTHYLPGQRPVGTTSVAIPLGQRSVLDDGPFYAYLVTGRRLPSPGRPLPGDVLRVGTFRFHHRTGARFDLTARLTVPDIRGDFYPVMLCNDPCTVTGFSQPVMGYLSIVQTRREAELLNELQHRQARIGTLVRSLRTQRKQLAAAESTLHAVERDDQRVNAEMSRLGVALAAARGRPRFDAQAIGGAGLLLLAAIAVAILGRRRRATPPIGETDPRTIPIRVRDDELVG